MIQPQYGGHIDRREAAILVTLVLSAMLYLQYPSILVGVGGPAAWQVVLVMTAAALLFFLPTAALAKRFPGQGLAEISEQAAGPVLGPLLVLGVTAWLVASVSLTLRNFTETFIIAILPLTPPSVLALVAMGCAAFASYRGFEALSRTAQVLYPLIILSSLAILLLLLSRVETAMLFPFWGYGPGMTLSGGLWAAGLAAEAVILLTLGFSFRSPGDLRAGGLWGIGLFGLLALVSVLMLVTVFGAADAAQLPFPLLSMARIVFLSRFVQSIEAVVILFWFFAAVIRISAIFHAAVISMSGALRLPFYRPLIFPLGVLVVSFSLLPKDFVSVIRFERDWVRPAGLIVMALPLLLLLLAALRSKGGDARHEA